MCIYIIMVAFSPQIDHTTLYNSQTTATKRNETAKLKCTSNFQQQIVKLIFSFLRCTTTIFIFRKKERKREDG